MGGVLLNRSLGSSPRLRGTAQYEPQRWIPSREIRFIPAPAGNSLDSKEVRCFRA